jgi:hypothetical protein
MKLLMLMSVALAAAGCGHWSDAQRQKGSPPATQKGPSLEEKLANLKKCGIGLTQPYTVKDLLELDDPEPLEEPGYDMLLIDLGTDEEEPNRKLAANVWYFNTETIYEDGDYKHIADRMVEMTQGSLVLQDIQDHVDVEHNEAWLSFTFKGRPMKIDLKVNDDWVDTTIFARFVELLREADSSKIYLYYDLGGGQDCVLSCVKKTEYDCLKSQGIKFVPLTPANFAEAE